MPDGSPPVLQAETTHPPRSEIGSEYARRPDPTVTNRGLKIREPLAHQIVTTMDISPGEYLSSQYSFRSRRHTLALVVVKVRCARPVRIRQRVCSGANPLISGVTAPGRGQNGKEKSPGNKPPGLFWWRWGRVELPAWCSSSFAGVRRSRNFRPFGISARCHDSSSVVGVGVRIGVILLASRS